MSKYGSYCSPQIVTAAARCTVIVTQQRRLLAITRTGQRCDIIQELDS
jgi:hypothetical protein